MALANALHSVESHVPRDVDQNSFMSNCTGCFKCMHIYFFSEFMLERPGKYFDDQVECPYGK